MKLCATFDIEESQEPYMRQALERLGGEINHGGLEIVFPWPPLAPIPPADLSEKFFVHFATLQNAEPVEAEAAAEPPAQPATDDSGTREGTVGDASIVLKE